MDERDERVAEARQRAADNRRDVAAVGEELIALYADPDELLKHARVVDLTEIKEYVFSLNIPRYVDTYEPEQRVKLEDALEALDETEKAARNTESRLRELLKGVGYAS